MTAPASHRLPLAALALAGTLASARGALAQDASRDLVRRRLLDEADVARRAGDHAAAFDRAQRAGQIAMSPSVRLMIAQEAEALLAQPGHDAALLDALSAAAQCVVEADAAERLHHRAEIRGLCAAIASRLQPRIATVRVEVTAAPADDVRVSVNGRDVPAALWGAGFPVVPGEVRVEAAARDGRVFSQTVAVTAGATAPVAVRLERPEVRARDALLAEARAAATRDDHAAALAAATRAVALSDGADARRVMAVEGESAGDAGAAIVAWESAGRCVTMSAAARDDDTARVCREVRARLDARVARVRLALPHPPPAGLRVQMSDAAIAESSWGDERAVPAGEVAVRFEVDGAPPWRVAVNAANGRVTAVPFDDPRSRATIAPPRPPTRRWTAGMWALTGVGAAALATGLALVLVVEPGARDERLALCPSDGRGGGACPDDAALQRARSLFDDEQLDHGLGVALASVGVAAVGAAALWYGVHREATATAAAAPSWHLGVAPSRDGWGLRLHGAF